MNARGECGPCILHWVYERAGILASEEKRFALIRQISEIFTEEFHSEANVGALSNRITSSIHEYLSKSASYYREIKQKSNQQAHRLLSAARKYIEKGRNPKERFDRACRLASASNVAPMTAPGKAFKFEEVALLLKGKHRSPLLIGDVYGTARGATQILYLADNAGEIGFDALLIAELRAWGSKINLLVKEDPFFEDATRSDALFFSIDKLVERIQTVKGFFVPGKASRDLYQIFDKSDLVIAKGTGNYEALNGELKGKKAIYLLKVKCKPVAGETGLPVGSFIIKAEQGQ